MHKIIRTIAVMAACVGALAGHAAMAASGNTKTVAGTASAQVTAPMQLVATGAMQFGKIAQPVTGGTLTMSPQGTLTSTGDMGTSSAIAQTGTRSAASFTLTGAPSALYAIYGVSQVTISNGAAKMTLGQFTTNVTFAIGQIATNGTAAFSIGGTLTATAGQAVGTYTGTFPITVAYY
ncbi:DUF4402 domain-containing protein [Novosphingobium sp.]|uniref:DUF4402 domain-containing protein n=1 Tax=Novosphingobium sp. TaxID=1874826 RepID=UPI0033400568